MTFRVAACGPCRVGRNVTLALHDAPGARPAPPIGQLPLVTVNWFALTPGVPIANPWMIIGAAPLLDTVTVWALPVPSTWLPKASAPGLTTAAIPGWEPAIRTAPLSVAPAGL